MSKESRTQHLTDAEFSRLLDGAQPGASAEAHLSVCGYCRQELETVLDSLGSFRTLATVWSDKQAPRRIPLPAHWAGRFNVQTSWSAGLAATAITGLLAFWLGFSPHVRQASLEHAPAMAPTTAELAADNRLLSSIDEELSDQGTPAVSAVQMQAEPRPTAHRMVGTITD